MSNIRDTIKQAINEVEGKRDVGKYTKTSVDYSKGMPQSHCGICRYYNGMHLCMRVKGYIDPQMWCKLFEKRK